MVWKGIEDGFPLWTDGLPLRAGKELADDWSHGLLSAVVVQGVLLWNGVGGGSHTYAADEFNCHVIPIREIWRQFSLIGLTWQLKSLVHTVHDPIPQKLARTATALVVEIRSWAETYDCVKIRALKGLVLAMKGYPMASHSDFETKLGWKSYLDVLAVGNYAAHHVHIFSCALDKKRYYYHLLHTVAQGLFHHH